MAISNSLIGVFPQTVTYKKLKQENEQYLTHQLSQQIS